MAGVLVVGPRITLSLAGMRVAVGAIDIVLALLVLIGILHERFRTGVPLLLIVPIAFLLVVCWFGINFLSEWLRIRLARSGVPALPAVVSIPTAHIATVFEARSTAQAARGGLAGMGIDLAIGLIAVGIFWLVDGTDRRLADLVAVAALAVSGSAAIRFLTAPSLNGGRILRWMFEFTFDDEENAIRAMRWVGYGVALILFLVGILLLATQGEGGFWGIGLATTGIDIGVLATLAPRQTLWLQTASDRTLGDLLENPHAMVSLDSPLDEMLSVLSVDGPRVVAVVRDPAGNPAGIMQFRQLRAGIRKQSNGLTISDVMIPIDALPLVSRQMTLLEAASCLSTNTAPALRFQNAHGRMVIATMRDLGLPG